MPRSYHLTPTTHLSPSPSPTPYPILPPPLSAYPTNPAILKISRSASTSPVFATASLLSLASRSSSSIRFRLRVSSSSPPQPHTSSDSISKRSWKFRPPLLSWLVGWCRCRELEPGREAGKDAEVGDGAWGCACVGLCGELGERGEESASELARLRRRALGPVAIIGDPSGLTTSIDERALALLGCVLAGLTLG